MKVMNSRRPRTPAGFKLGLLAALLATLAGCRQTAAPTTPNLVLVTIDTLRADSLERGEPAGSASPRLDALMQDSLVFERAQATAPYTGPSHASILTSRHPSAHGVVLNGHRSGPFSFGEQVVTLADHLSAAGLATGAVVSAGPLHERFGFAQGFETFSLVETPDDAIEAGGPAAEVSRRGLDWLRGRDESEDDAPFFLWVHYFEPHLPYISSAEFRNAAGLEDLRPVMEDEMLDLPADFVRAAYLAEVLETDHHLAALIDGLADRESARETIVAVVADHGEHLGEHGLIAHHGLRREVLHVPMFIHAPRFAGGERRGDVVSTIDLAPTLLELMDLDALPGAQGRSLLGPGSAGDEEPVHAEWRDYRLKFKRHEVQAGDFQISVQDGDDKLIRDLLFPESSLLFDLAADPAEDHDLLAAQPERRRRLEELLDEHVAEELPGGLADVEMLQFDPESVELLKSLGYVK